MAKTQLPPDLKPRKLPADVDDAIRDANEEIERASANRLELPVTVLVRQRDRALREACEARAHVESSLATARSEQDRFVAAMMREHHSTVVELEEQHASQLGDLRRQLVALTERKATSPGLGAVKPSGEETILREQLMDALGSLAMTRDESRELREEIDAAAVSYDDMRQEMWNAVVEARDEAIALQSKIDDLTHALEDEREAREAQSREFQAELSRLRDEHDEALEAASERSSAPARPTLPPEIAQAREEAARAKEEVHQLRLELIETKRNLSRRSQELQAASAELRRSRRPTQRLERVQSATDLEQLGAQGTETPAFQRFMRRRESITSTYSDAGSVDVLRGKDDPSSSDD